MDENERPNDTNKIPSPAPFSTLEVDHEAIHQEQLRKAQKSALYPGAAEQGINVLPQVGANPDDLPEAVPPSGEDGGRSNTSRSRICGMRKSTFWILSAIILLLVIGAAVGGGVGGSLASSNNDTPNAANSSNSSTSTTTSFLPNTNLAAVNFTQNSVEHHLVFFQTPGDGIYQSAWNSSGKTWAVSPVNIKDSTISRSELFKTPTPMSASYYACSSNTPNLTLYFLDSSSRLRQLHTANPDDSDWTTGPLDSITNVPDATHLASYSCQHPSYPDYSDIWYQDSNGYYQIIDAFGRSKTKVDSTLGSSRDVTVLKPPQNSSLAFVPHYIYDYNQTTKDPWLSVFFVNDDVLWEYHYKNNQMTFSKHFDKPNDPSLPPSANIAGFSWGYNQDLPNVGGMQVLYTMPDDDTGGISMCKLNKISDEGTWQYTNAKFTNNPFKGVARYSSVAATEAGRVYAVVDDAGKVELREWEYVQDEDTYRSLGAVNTNVSQG